MDAASFAQRQLEKYGWTKGQGLGKEKKGISKAIGISIKDDTNGLGAKADEWSNAWWDHCFNKTTANIKIEATDDGIELKKETAAKSAKKERSLLYGAFVKSGETELDKKDEQDEDKRDYTIKISDADLFAACEGRTARKGARGEQPGKLKRVIASTTPTTSTLIETKVSKKNSKKSKKEKKSKKSKRGKDDEKE